MSQTIHFNGQSMVIDSNKFVSFETLYNYILKSEEVQNPQFTYPIWSTFNFKNYLELKSITDLKPRRLQRLEVMPLEKRKMLICSMLEGTVRVPSTSWSWNISNNFPDEKPLKCLDGLQRYSTIEEFVNNKFSVNPDNCQEFYFSEVPKGASKKSKVLTQEQRETILNYNFSSTFYINASPSLQEKIFTVINTGSTALSDQEIRNALQGALSSLIRDYVRPEEGKKSHPLFELEERTIESKNGKVSNKVCYKLFNHAVTNKRFKMEEFLTKLLFIGTKAHDKLSQKIDIDINANILYNFVNDKQKNNSEWYNPENDNWKSAKIKFDKILNQTLTLFNEVSDKHRERMTTGFAFSFAAIYQWIKSDGCSYHVQRDGTKKFVAKFMNMYTKWCHPSVYATTSDGEPRMQWGEGNETPMEPFNMLFGGYNQRQINTVIAILLEELENSDLSEWGLVETVDSTRTFSDDVKIKRWIEFGQKCYYTGRYLFEFDIVADHIYPWSKGGKTTDDNCAPTSYEINSLKSDMTPEEFIPLLHSKGYPIADHLTHLVSAAV
jgi:hypothetical protein